MRRVGGAVFLLLWNLACPRVPDGNSGPCAPDEIEVASDCIPVGWHICPAGFETASGGAGCQPVLPEESCPAGSRPSLGTESCVAVGWQSCADPFRAARSGWGCEAVLPAAACLGATRAAVGNESCVPLGDCSAPFPPAEATIVVDDDFGPPDLGPTRFRTIAQAVTAAPSGAVIAIDAGTYAEGIWPTRTVTLVGRCAEQVILDGTGLGVPGVYTTGARDIVVRGVTLRGHFQGARAQGGGSILVEDVLIENARLSGLIAWQEGSSVHAVRTVVRGTLVDAGQFGWGGNADAGGDLIVEDSEIGPSAEAGIIATATPGTTTQVTVIRSYIHDTNLGGGSLAGAGLGAFWGARMEVAQSVVRTTRRTGVVALGAGTEITLQEVLVWEVLTDGSGETASGIEVADGATVTVDRVAVVDSTEVGLFALGTGALLVGQAVVVRGTRPGADGLFGIGGGVQLGARIDLENAVFVSNAYYGVMALDSGSTLSLGQSAVLDTGADPQGLLGRGLNAEGGASVELDDVVFARNRDESLLVRGEPQAGARTTVRASSLLVFDSLPRSSGFHGVGIAVENGALVEVTGGVVLRASEAAVIIDDDLGLAGSPAEIHLQGVLIRDTRPTSSGISGAGLVVGGVAVVRDSRIEGSHEFGVLVGNPGSRVVLIRTTIDDVVPRASEPIYGHGVVVVNDGSVVMEECLIERTVIGVGVDRASGAITRTLLRDNDVGVHVQGGTNLEVVSTSAPAEPLVLQVTEDTVFEGNDARIGGGVVPFPSDPVPDRP